MNPKHAHRICSTTPPPSARKPKLNLSTHQIDQLLQPLEKFHKIFTSLFQRKEQRHWSRQYIHGQMLKLERKSIESMASNLEGGNVQAMQQFISDSPWDDTAVIHVHEQEVAKTLGHKDGALIVDGCDFPKQGHNSVGVASQHCGALGKTANCQASVVLVYASDKGHTLVDRRLFMPERWFSPEYADLRKECGVPEDLTPQTKNVLGWSMLAPLLDKEILPFQWILGDEAFGRDTKLLNKIANKGKYYFVEIPCNTLIWQPRAPHEYVSKRVDKLAATLDARHWRRVIVHEGTKGPIIAEIAVLREVFSEQALPAREEWLVVRRQSKTQPLSKWKFYRCNAPKQTSHDKLAELTAWRWPIESAIEECKTELGMDHYEVRSWRGWHHHMTMTMLSHHFLVRTRVELGEDAPALTVSQVRLLLDIVLPKREFNAETILQELQRTQQQNYAAYRSHRKRRLKQKIGQSNLKL
ncbi:MAG: IS701 family transposase [bacterium]